MDIQKEKEAFEAWFESRYDAHFMQFALDLDFYVDKHTQTCWEAWQAAKAQAVPEGFEIGRLQDRITELLDERQGLYAQINKGVAEKIELIIRDVAELPDRTSPEDWPEALIVTSGELEEILTQHLIQKCRNQEQGE